MKKKPGKNKISGLSSTPLLITRYRRPTVAKQEPSKSLRDDPSMMHWACVFIDEEHTRNDMVPMEPYSTRVVSRLFFLCKTFSGGRSEAPRNVVNSLRPQSGDNLCRPSQLLDENDNFHWLLPPQFLSSSSFRPRKEEDRRRDSPAVGETGPGTTEKNDSELQLDSLELHIISSYLSADACRCSRNERCPWSRGHGGRRTLKRYIKLRERGSCMEKCFHALIPDRSSSLPDHPSTIFVFSSQRQTHVRLFDISVWRLQQCNSDEVQNIIATTSDNLIFTLDMKLKNQPSCRFHILNDTEK